LAFTLKIGINQFSYHRYFGEVTRWETDPGIRWSVTDFIRRAGSLQLDAISLQTHYLNSNDLKIVNDECLAFNLNWIIEWGHPDGLKMGTSPEAAADLTKWLRVTSDLGGKLVRIVAGYPTYRGQEPVPTQMARLIPLLSRGVPRSRGLRHCFSAGKSRGFHTLGTRGAHWASGVS
jgi:hypothetical protein